MKIIERAIGKLKEMAKNPLRSKAWLQGWEDSAHSRGNRNQHAAGSAEWRDYEAGFEHWKRDNWAQ
ncbi:MAG: hypothetical protein GY862_26850 [Gammaproteobacteria bacterium]|nr:hypothetical protein [Gammaproteobacteria bacterium]MCP5013812.1 hypothetical protein [Ketobacter sp.]